MSYASHRHYKGQFEVLHNPTLKQLSGEEYCRRCEKDLCVREGGYDRRLTYVYRRLP